MGNNDERLLFLGEQLSRQQGEARDRIAAIPPELDDDARAALADVHWNRAAATALMIQTQTAQTPEGEAVREKASAFLAAGLPS